MQPARLKSLHGPSKAELRKARAMAYAVIEHHFSKRPRRLILRGGGLTNVVFEVEHDAGPLVVRLSSDRARINAYIKEQWAVAKARAAGVPTQEILEVGNAVVP